MKFNIIEKETSIENLFFTNEKTNYITYALCKNDNYLLIQKQCVLSDEYYEENTFANNNGIFAKCEVFGNEIYSDSNDNCDDILKAERQNQEGRSSCITPSWDMNKLCRIAR